MSDETSLYRYFSGDRLLYIGISLNPIARMKQHRGTAWFRQIDNIKVEWFESRAEAVSAEKAAIDTEKPAYNKQHVRRVPVDEQMAYIRGVLDALPSEQSDAIRGVFQSFGVDDITDLDAVREYLRNNPEEGKEPPLDL